MYVLHSRLDMYSFSLIQSYVSPCIRMFRTKTWIEGHRPPSIADPFASVASTITVVLNISATLMTMNTVLLMTMILTVMVVMSIIVIMMIMRRRRGRRLILLEFKLMFEFLMRIER